MTTIVYKDGVMACDTYVTGNGARLTGGIMKVVRLASGALLGSSGEGDIRPLIDILNKVTKPSQLPKPLDLAELKQNFEAILVLPKGQRFWVRCYQDGATGNIVPITDNAFAVGSGEQFAMGAIAAGASPREAVRIACKYDNYSQEPVRQKTL